MCHGFPGNPTEGPVSIVRCEWAVTVTNNEVQWPGPRWRELPVENIGGGRYEPQFQLGDCCLSVRPSVRPPVCLSVCLFMRLSASTGAFVRGCAFFLSLIEGNCYLVSVNERMAHEHCVLYRGNGGSFARFLSARFHTDAVVCALLYCCGLVTIEQA